MDVPASKAYHVPFYPNHITSADFDPKFVWGAATSAYQVEGAATEDGRTPCIWDDFCDHNPDTIFGGSTGKNGTNGYHKVKEDVEMMKNMGLTAYRFSISWTRILPNGRRTKGGKQDNSRKQDKSGIRDDGVNQDGVNYYNELINELIAKKIEPYITLWHWDTPQCLEDEYMGFLDEKIMFMEPLFSGNYPKSMIRNVTGVGSGKYKKRLTEFTREESNLLTGSYDFIGVNYYCSEYATIAEPTDVVSYTTDNKVHQQAEDIDGKPIGPKGGVWWFNSYPPGLYKVLIHIKNTYGDPLIYVTENGWADDDKKKKEEACIDIERIEYYQLHLQNVRNAISDGVRVKGYFAWSLMDNFEWASGYSVRFGLVFVDNNDEYKRYLKKSAIWFTKFLDYGKELKDETMAKTMVEIKDEPKKRLIENPTTQGVKKSRK